MVLTAQAVLKEIENNVIKITPFKRENLGPASYDITLSTKLRVFKKESLEKVHLLTNSINYKDLTEPVEIQNEYVLQPGEMVIGISEEKIELPGNICAWIQGRSSFARVGLSIHITASFVQPGVKNKQVFEILNDSQMPLALIPGTRIGQLIFQRCEGTASYEGKFQGQEL